MEFLFIFLRETLFAVVMIGLIYLVPKVMLFAFALEPQNQFRLFYILVGGYAFILGCLIFYFKSIRFIRHLRSRRNQT